MSPYPHRSRRKPEQAKNPRLERQCVREAFQFIVFATLIAEHFGEAGDRRAKKIVERQFKLAAVFIGECRSDDARLRKTTTVIKTERVVIAKHASGLGAIPMYSGQVSITAAYRRGVALATGEEHLFHQETLVRYNTLLGCGDDTPESPLSPSPATAGAATAAAETDADAVATSAVLDATQPASDQDDLLGWPKDDPTRNASSWTFGTPLPPTNVTFTPTARTATLARWYVDIEWDDPRGGPRPPDNPYTGIDVTFCPVNRNIHQDGIFGCNTLNSSIIRKSFDYPAPRGEHRAWIRLKNSTGEGAWGGGQIFAAGQSRFKPEQPQNLRAEFVSAVDPSITLGGQQFNRGVVRVSWNTPPDLDFVDRARVRSWIQYARRDTTQTETPPTLTDDLGRDWAYISVPEGRATFSVQLGNNMGWGQSLGTNERVEPAGILAPGAPTSVSLSGQGGNRKLTWQAPDDFGGGPLHRYEYFYGNNCRDSDPQRNWSLRGTEGFIPRAEYEVKTNSDKMSVRAVNSTGAGPCRNAG